jgi:hypothetical protein
LLLLGTYRLAEVIISQSPLKALKQDLVIHNLSHEIALERLEESDIAEYLGIEFVDAAFPDEPENPLRAIFLAAVSVRQILSENGVANQRDSTNPGEAQPRKSQSLSLSRLRRGAQR